MGEEENVSQELHSKQQVSAAEKCVLTVDKGGVTRVVTRDTLDQPVLRHLVYLMILIAGLILGR